MKFYFLAQAFNAWSEFTLTCYSYGWPFENQQGYITNRVVSFFQ